MLRNPMNESRSPGLQTHRLRLHIGALALTACFWGVLPPLAEAELVGPGGSKPQAFCTNTGACCNGTTDGATPLCCAIEQPMALFTEDPTSTPTSTSSGTCTGQGANTSCRGTNTCCMPDGSWENTDSICCGAQGGDLVVPGLSNPGGGCDNVPCYAPDGTCQIQHRYTCENNGDVVGAGTACQTQHACCRLSGVCTLDTPDDCASVVDPGIILGFGTVCPTDGSNPCDTNGCCVDHTDPNAPFYCLDHTYYQCIVAESGTPQADNCTALADGDGDAVPDVCDNCPTVVNSPSGGTCTTAGTGLAGDPCTADLQCEVGEFCSMNQENSDLDEFGDVCDNCLNITNADQADCDVDYVGDVCDNCPAAANDLQDDAEDDGIGDACDNCPTVASNDNVLDFDGDGDGDICDDDIDGDTVPNEYDVCDYTPASLIIAVVRDWGDPLAGTVVYDVDGDCDVDQDDANRLQMFLTGSGGASGMLVSDACGFVATDTPSEAPATTCIPSLPQP